MPSPTRLTLIVDLSVAVLFASALAKSATLWLEAAAGPLEGIAPAAIVAVVALSAFLAAFTAMRLTGQGRMPRVAEAPMQLPSSRATPLDTLVGQGGARGGLFLRTGDPHRAEKEAAEGLLDTIGLLKRA